MKNDVCCKMTRHGKKLISTEHSYSVNSASISPNESSSPATEQLDKIVCQFLVEQNVPGATLAVAKHGRIVYEQGYGLAGAGRRMRATSGLRVASVSKPVTAIAVLRLCQEGRLSLDAKVFGAKGLLKQFKTRGDKRLWRVTVRHLLQHSAGWDRDVAGDAVFWTVPAAAGVKVTSPQYNAHLLQYVLNRKLQFTPGSRHAYSNLGYLALGEVIEAVTGQSYESYVASLLPLVGVTHMYVGGEDRVHWQSQEGEYFNIREPATAASVLPGHEGSSVLPQYGSFLMRNTGAFGGWVATARDVLTILCALEAGHCQMSNEVADGGETCIGGSDSPADRQRKAEGRRAPLLDPSAVRSMLQRPAYESGRDWYGLGLDVQDGGDTWGHTGAMEGTCATAQRHRSGLSWAFLLNAWAADMDLDGVVKLALSSAEHLSPFPRGAVKMHGETFRLTTEDERQCVAVNVPLQKVSEEIEEKKLSGFASMWVGVNATDKKRGKDVTFNIVFSKDAEPQARKVLLDVDVSRLQTALHQCSEEGFEPECIVTYASDRELLGMALLSPSDGRRVQEVDIGVPAKEYVQLLTRRRKCGFSVLSQCVSQWNSELLVTAVMERGVGTDVGSSCAQVKRTPGGQVQTDCVKPCANRWASRKRKSSPPLSPDKVSSSASSLLPTHAAECLLAPPLTEQPATEADVPLSGEKSEFQNISSVQHEHTDKAPPATKNISRTKNVCRRPRKGRVKPLSPVKKCRTLSWVQMTLESFLAELGRQARHCVGLRNVHFYPADGDWFVSGVWSPRVTHNCYHRMGVSHLGLLPALAEAAARNVRLRFLCRYEEEGAQYFALFWDTPQV